MTSAIAFSINGEPFDLPPSTAGWRVRRLKPKGAPEVVFGRDGLPLFLALDADIEDLRGEVPPPAEGRYRLDPVDDHHRAVPNAQASYVCVHAVERAPESTAPSAPAAGSQADTTVQLVNALLESQKRTVQLAEVYVSQFPVIVNALSGVVRAAGDAGLPTKVPLLVPVAPEAKPAEPAQRKDDEEGDEDDEEEDGDEDNDGEVEDGEMDVVEAAPESANEWAKVGMAAFKRLEPYIDPFVAALTAKLSKGAHGGANARPTAGGAPVADLQAHMRAILAALTPEEAAEAMRLAGELSVTEQFAHAQKLGGMSVPEGVAFVRAELARRGMAPSEREMSAAEIDAHVAAIRAQLTPDDSKALELMVEELPFELRRQYLENLASMSVSEALAKVRRELAGLNREFTAAHSAAEPRNARNARGVRASTAAPVSATKATSPSAKTAPQAGSPAPAPARRDRLHIVRAPLDISHARETEPVPPAPPASATVPTDELGAPLQEG